MNMYAGCIYPVRRMLMGETAPNLRIKLHHVSVNCKATQAHGVNLTRRNKHAFSMVVMRADCAELAG